MDPITIALGLASVVPSIVRWIAGDDAADTAQKVVDIAKNVTGKSDPKDAADAINSDPSLALQFKLAWLQHESTMYAAETERLKIQLADTDSARRREIETKDWAPKALALFVTGGFFGLLVAMLFYPVPPASKDILSIMVGALGAGWAAIVSYYYGASNDKPRAVK